MLAPVKVVDLKAGECYRTANNTVRNIESIEQGKVRYRSRGTVNEFGWTTTNSFQFQNLSYFAFDVVERVAHDWEPSVSGEARYTKRHET
jgi:hypothetical protein